MHNFAPKFVFVSLNHFYSYILWSLFDQSTLDALVLEEAYHEEVLNRTHSLDNLQTRTLIDCTKLLAEGLNINKGKAKALLMNAKEVCQICVYSSLIFVCDLETNAIFLIVFLVVIV